MKRNRKIAKCPKCLPDRAGAIFKTEYNCETGKVEWTCQNCWHKMPCRRNKPTRRITPSMQKLLDRFAAAGWVLESGEWLSSGRTYWVKFSHPTRQWWTGDITSGSITPRGSFQFRTYGIGKTTLVTDNIGLDVYLGVR